jgi:hypothetical protein
MFSRSKCCNIILSGAMITAAAITIEPFGPAWAGDDRPVAVVEQVQGKATIDKSGTVSPIVVGAPVSRYDRLETSAGARLALTFKDGSRLVLGENGRVTIEDWRPEQGRSSGVLLLDLQSGAVRLTASKPAIAPDKRVELRTPVAVISVRGTDVWSGPIDSATGVMVLAGKVDVRNDAGSVLMDTPHVGTIIKDKNSPPERARGFHPDQIMKAMGATDFK